MVLGDDLAADLPRRRARRFAAHAALLTALMVLVNAPGNIAGGWLLAHGVRRGPMVVAASAIMAACSAGMLGPLLPDAARYLLCLVFSACAGVIPGAIFSGPAGAREIRRSTSAPPTAWCCRHRRRASSSARSRSPGSPRIPAAGARRSGRCSRSPRAARSAGSPCAHRAPAGMSAPPESGSRED